MKTKEILKNTENYMKDRGYSFESGIQTRLFLSLAQKPFVLLTGGDGCGKYSLAKLFCESLGASEENERFVQILPHIRTNSADIIFGSKRQDGTFLPGELMKMCMKAHGDIQNPYFVYIDDVNMSAPGIYLRRLFNTIGSRTRTVDDKIVTNPVFEENYFETENDKNTYGHVTYPENLYIIASISHHDSAFAIDSYLTDRADFLQINHEDFGKLVFSKPEKAMPFDVKNEFLKPRYLSTDDSRQIEYMQSVAVFLAEINKLLKFSGCRISIRTRNDIICNLLLNKDLDLLSQNDCVDNVIMQRILPSLNLAGSSAKPVLSGLFKLCAPDGNGDYSINSLRMFKSIHSMNCRYPKSAEKITLMTRRLEESGFCSFWSC